MSTAVADPPAAPYTGNGTAADDAPGDDPQELVLEVGDGQLSFNVGGKKPTSSSLRIVGGKVDLKGVLAKGEGAVIRLEVKVSSVAFVDKVDSKTGSVTGCERQHKARITGIAVVDG